MEELNINNLEKYYDQAIELGMTYGPKLIHRAAFIMRSLQDRCPRHYADF